MLGAGIDAQTARTSLMQVLKRPQFADLRAVREGTVHAPCTTSTTRRTTSSPLKPWPSGFTRKSSPTLIHQLTLNELNQEFLDTPLAGQYWISEQQ